MDRGRVLRPHRAGRTDRACEQFGRVAGIGFHIEHLHAFRDAGEGQHLGGLAALIGLPVGIAAVRGGDDRLIVRGFAALRERGGAGDQHECNKAESREAGRTGHGHSLTVLERISRPWCQITVSVM